MRPADRPCPALPGACDGPCSRGAAARVLFKAAYSPGAGAPWCRPRSAPLTARARRCSQPRGRGTSRRRPRSRSRCWQTAPEARPSVSTARAQPPRGASALSKSAAPRHFHARRFCGECAAQSRPALRGMGARRTSTSTLPRVSDSGVTHTTCAQCRAAQRGRRTGRGAAQLAGAQASLGAPWSPRATRP